MPLRPSEWSSALGVPSVRSPSLPTLERTPVPSSNPWFERFVNLLALEGAVNPNGATAATILSPFAKNASVAVPVRWVPGSTFPMRVLRTTPRPLGLRPFIDVEHESHRIRGRICFVTGLHRRKLMPVCCEQLTDNNHGVLQLRPVEPASY